MVHQQGAEQGNDPAAHRRACIGPQQNYQRSESKPESQRAGAAQGIEGLVISESHNAHVVAQNERRCFPQAIPLEPAAIVLQAQCGHKGHHAAGKGRVAPQLLQNPQGDNPEKGDPEQHQQEPQMICEQAERNGFPRFKQCCVCRMPKRGDGKERVERGYPEHAHAKPGQQEPPPPVQRVLQGGALASIPRGGKQKARCKHETLDKGRT